MILKNIISLIVSSDRGAQASGESATKIPCYCISHLEPIVPERFFSEVIALGDYGQTLPLHISKLDEFWHAARPVAFSSAGSFVIPKILKDSRSPLVGICSYRKILLPKPYGPDNPLFFLIEVRSSDVEDLSFSDTLPPDPALDFFVTEPLVFTDGIIGQYSRCHILQDLLNFTALCVDLGVMTSKEANDFLLCPIFIPGGCDFGFYPTDWLVDSQRRLELVGRAFVEKYRERLLSYDKYQVRALSFLIERLGSYFVVMELMERYKWMPSFSHAGAFRSGGQFAPGREQLDPLPPELFGRMHVFVDSYKSYVTGVAE